MRKIKVKLTELSNADVRYLSLVERSATRLPIRVMKADTQENSMSGIDLSSIARVLKGEPKVVPQVTGIVTHDLGDEVMPEVVAVLKAQGFAVDKITKSEDGTMLFEQQANPVEGAQLVRLSENVLLVVKGLPDADADGEQFIPGVNTAMDVLYSEVTEALTSDQPQAKIIEQVKKFEAHVLSLVKVLPSTVFKADMEIGSVVLKMYDKKKKKVVEKTMDEEKVMTPEEEAMAKEKAKDGVKKEEGTPAPAAETPPVVETPPAVVAGALVEKTDAEKLMAELSGLPKLVADLVTKMEGMSTDLATVKAGQATSESKVAEAVQKADNAAKQLAAVLVAPPQGSDTPSGRAAAVQKQDDFVVTDTAFQRRPARR